MWSDLKNKAESQLSIIVIQSYALGKRANKENISLTEFYFWGFSVHSDLEKGNLGRSKMNMILSWLCEKRTGELCSFLSSRIKVQKWPFGAMWAFNQAKWCQSKTTVFLWLITLLPVYTLFTIFLLSCI